MSNILEMRITASNTTSELTPMRNQLHGYGMTLFVNGNILVCGGVWTSNCTVYIAAGNYWITFAPLPMTIGYFAMITLQYYRPYVFSGWDGNRTVLNTVYAYDIQNSWTPRAPMQRPVWAHTAVALDTDTAMVCGGRNSNGAVQSQCYTYTICMCGRHNFVGIILVRRH
jgi:hypothetical protein